MVWIRGDGDMTELELLQEISYSLMVIKYIVLLTGGLYTGGILGRLIFRWDENG